MSRRARDGNRCSAGEERDVFYGLNVEKCGTHFKLKRDPYHDICVPVARIPP